MNTELNNILARWVAALAGGAVIVFAVYALLGAIDKTSLQIVATVFLFSIPAAYALGLQTAKAHTRGLEHGVDVKVTAQKQQTRRRAENRDIYLPDVPRTEALIVVQDDNSDKPVDM